MENKQVLQGSIFGADGPLKHSQFIFGWCGSGEQEERMGEDIQLRAPGRTKTVAFQPQEIAIFSVHELNWHPAFRFLFSWLHRGKPG